MFYEFTWRSGRTAAYCALLAFFVFVPASRADPARAPTLLSALNAQAPRAVSFELEDNLNGLVITQTIDVWQGPRSLEHAASALYTAAAWLTAEKMLNGEDYLWLSVTGSDGEGPYLLFTLRMRDLAHVRFGQRAGEGISQLGLLDVAHVEAMGREALESSRVLCKSIGRIAKKFCRQTARGLRTLRQAP